MAATSDIITTIPDTDQVLAGRFDRRVLTFARFIIPLHLVAIFVMAPFSSTVTSHFAHLAMALIGYWMAHWTRDSIKFIIFSHVYWTFSAITYLYAILRLQAVDFGLGNADRAALIALTAQAGLAVAFLLSPEGDPMRGIDPCRRADKLRISRLLVWPLYVAGVLGVLGELAGVIPSALAQLLTLLFYVAMAMQVARTDVPFINMITVSALTIFTFAAASSNERTALFGVILFLLFAALVRMQRVVTPAKLLLVFLGLRFLAVFSAVALSVRWARDTGLDVLSLFSSSFFSEETLWTLLNPYHVHEAERIYVSTLAQSSFYSEFMGRSIDILARLAVLPQMDIVTRQLDPLNALYRDQFLPIVLSALPSFGQDKQLIFSDVVVWDLGLRSRMSLGRPMITAEGELFAIGSYLAVFLTIGICFYIMHLAYRQLTRTIGARIPVILLFAQFSINTIFSTTLLSTVSGTVWTPLQLLFLLVVVFAVAGLTLRQSGSRMPLPQASE